ncbi:MAG: nitroreductase [Pseudomonadales bacterium]|jgi:nitroreductase
MSVSHLKNSMTVEEALLSRRSIRDFKSEPIAKNVLEAVFDLAQWAPSNCNSQPWEVCVASGESCERLRTKITEAAFKGEIGDMDIPYDGVYEGVYKDRQYGSANAVYSALGIERSDKARRGEFFMRNFCFFDAPHVAFFFINKKFGIREGADLGMYAQSVMLAMQANGIASCPQTSLGFFAGIVKEEFTVSDDLNLMFGLSFGYAADDSPINAIKIDRAPLSETTTFLD